MGAENTNFLSGFKENLDILDTLLIPFLTELDENTDTTLMFVLSVYLATSYV